jgi:hypothetical protein
MLANTLNTNEIKNAAGTEVEFQRISTNGRSTEFSKITEAPNLPHRLTVSHSESGSGVAKRRRSVVRVDLTVAGQVDTTVPAKISSYVVMDMPVGNLTASTEAANCLANLMSFCASLGASTTILYDGTGNGAVCLLSGGL